MYGVGVGRLQSAVIQPLRSVALLKMWELGITNVGVLSIATRALFKKLRRCSMYRLLQAWEAEVPNLCITIP